MSHRSISRTPAPLQVPAGHAGGRGRPSRGLRRAAHANPVRTPPRLLFAVGLALALSSGAVLSASMTTTQTKIKADWVAFFAGSTSAKHKITLLQNGSSFAEVINAQASSPLSKSVAAKVSSVTVTSATKAKVHYSLTLGGMPALSNQTGVAVLQGGTWKVGDQSFCALLALEQTKTPACPSK